MPILEARVNKIICFLKNYFKYLLWNNSCTVILNNLYKMNVFS